MSKKNAMTGFKKPAGGAGFPSSGRSGNMNQAGISGPPNVKAGKAKYENAPELGGPAVTINAANSIGGYTNGSVGDAGLMKGGRTDKSGKISADLHKRIVSSDPLRVGVKPVTGK